MATLLSPKPTRGRSDRFVQRRRTVLRECGRRRRKVKREKRVGRQRITSIKHKGMKVRRRLINRSKLAPVLTSSAPHPRQRKTSLLLPVLARRPASTADASPLAARGIQSVAVNIKASPRATARIRCIPHKTNHNVRCLAMNQSPQSRDEDSQLRRLCLTCRPAAIAEKRMAKLGVNLRHMR